MTVYTQPLGLGQVEYSGSVTFRLTWAENRCVNRNADDANAQCPSGYANLAKNPRARSPHSNVGPTEVFMPALPYRFLVMELQ